MDAACWWTSNVDEPCATGSRVGWEVVWETHVRRSCQSVSWVLQGLCVACLCLEIGVWASRMFPIETARVHMELGGPSRAT